MRIIGGLHGILASVHLFLYYTGKNNEPKQLYYFKRLSETEHYTEAASSLHHPASLSHAISELEKELGSRYSPDRAERKITQNGKRFLPYVEDALASLENGR